MGVAVVLKRCAAEELRAVVGFLWAGGLVPGEIHGEVIQVYAEHCLEWLYATGWRNLKREYND